VSPAGQPTGRPITLGATRTSDHFVVRSASASTAEQTLTLAEHAWDLLAPHFEFLPSEPVTIVVVEDTAEYERIQPAAMTRGFATFGGDHIYLRGADLDQEVVTHELVHILLGKNIRRGLAVPDWFNEGFAQFMSGADSHRREVFYLAASGRLLPLPELDRLDALRGPDRELPTIQGLAVVGFFVDEYGRDRLWDLVSRLSHARTFSQALLDTYGRSDLELSHEWQAYADTEYGLLSVVGLETLGTAMLGLLSLLAAVVWFATRIRLRARPASPLDLSPWEIESAERAAAMLDTGGGAGDAQGARGEDSGDRRTT
ncbi:MAG TPA: hypothetical protein VFD74_04690, partial [Thermoleophilia bacterium]|nr:hypothetical protein [Thermoleophilia bacterium]